MDCALLVIADYRYQDFTDSLPSLDSRPGWLDWNLLPRSRRADTRSTTASVRARHPRGHATRIPSADNARLRRTAVAVTIDSGTTFPVVEDTYLPNPDVPIPVLTTYVDSNHEAITLGTAHGLGLAGSGWTVRIQVTRTARAAASYLVAVIGNQVPPIIVAQAYLPPNQTDLIGLALTPPTGSGVVLTNQQVTSLGWWDAQRFLPNEQRAINLSNLLVAPMPSTSRPTADTGALRSATPDNRSYVKSDSLLRLALLSTSATKSGR